MKLLLTLLVISLNAVAINAQCLRTDTLTRNSAVNQVKTLYSSNDQSSFVIWVSGNVPPHTHNEHTESVYIIEGTGMMLLGDSTFKLVPGQFIHIPRNTVHAVKASRSNPLKVISIQAPRFTGNDRHAVKLESPWKP